MIPDMFFRVSSQLSMRSPSPESYRFVDAPLFVVAPGNGKIPVSAMSDGGFSRLLARLDPDADRAAAAYEHLRLALEKFFDWHGAWPADECADETLDRLLRKLDDVEIQDVRRYARGIARLVLLEWQRRPTSVSITEDPDLVDVSTPPAFDRDEAPLQECFDRCLAELPSDSRTLVLEYYVAERRTKIDMRRRLARTLNISESALRNRVQRVRDRLERCVHSCAAAGAGIGRHR
jgi:RNA polymerase sigma factor (sigma-70 family)